MLERGCFDREWWVGFEQVFGVFYCVFCLFVLKQRARLDWSRAMLEELDHATVRRRRIGGIKDVR